MKVKMKLFFSRQEGSRCSPNVPFKINFKHVDVKTKTKLKKSSAGKREGEHPNKNKFSYFSITTRKNKIYIFFFLLEKKENFVAFQNFSLAPP